MAKTRLRSEILPRLTSFLWGSIVLLVVLLAVYVSFGRYLTSLVAANQDNILRELNARLPFAVEVDELRGHWDSFLPRFEITGLRVVGTEQDPYPVNIGQLTIGPDVMASLRSASLQLKELSASAVHLHADVTEDGQLLIPGIPAGGGFSGSRLFNFLFNTQHITFEEVVLQLHEGESRRDVHLNMELLRDQDFRRFRVSLLSPSQKSWFRAIAEGQGDPLDFQRFVGNFHMESHVDEVEFYRELGQLLGVDWQGGKVQSELWFSTDRGKLVAAADFSAENLLMTSIENPQKEFQFDNISAVLTGKMTDGSWQFVASDINMSDVHEALQVDTLRGEFGPQGLTLGSENLDLGEVVDYVLAEGLLPEKLQDVVARLAPRGQLDQAQFLIGDLQDMASSWRFRGNFSELAVDPFKGAPGVERAKGYFSIGGDDGLVQLKGEDFSMSFPTIYHHALDYTEFAIQLEWLVYPDRFELRSGPFYGLGEEGAVTGLFAMDIPFDKTLSGLEMDLMVGLEKAHPRHRDKYLPYTMSETLLGWLEDSIGEGHIADGAFLYRGSLARDKADYRSIQLFFNMSDTVLDYHPDWPALTDVTGLVLIDDADVGVIGESATIRNSAVDNIDIKLRTSADKHLLLDVQARMRGDASDGLVIVNNSPLRELVGDVFIDWQLQGPLLTELQLGLDLTDTTIPPIVDVRTDWDDVKVDLGSIGLELEQLSGRLLFSDRAGFSADDMTASLWGRPLHASVSQGRSDQGLGELDVAVKGSVDAGDVARWLDLDLLAFAQGQADVDMHILIPGETISKSSRIVASSSLKGVSMDLPDPWAKSAEDEVRFELSMPMVGDHRRLLARLNDAVYLGVRLGEEGYEGGSLGFAAPLQPSDRGDFIIGGHIERVDAAQWSRFISTYLMGGEDDPLQRQLVWLAARDLSIGEFTSMGASLHDLQVDARELEKGWEVNASLDWFQASARINDDFTVFDIILDRLDLDGLDPELLSSLQQQELGDFQMPQLNVSIGGIVSEGKAIGNLIFSVTEEDSVYRFRDIGGRMVGLDLGGGEQGLELDWRTGDSAQTRVRGRLAFEDFGEVLAHFNYDRIIETSGGDLLLDLEWPAAPTGFELGLARGSLDVDVREGRFLNTSAGASGTLRVVSILNLADFVSRLSLDLSYLFQSGVAFDSITGNVLFKSGQLDIPGLDVLGRSSRFQFVGIADVPTQTLDGELVATLPVASNLPWIAALVTGLPAAAAVYVVSKVFTKQMDRFSSVVYSIDGPWNDPQVNFQRIFDDTAAQTAAAGAVAAEVVGDEAGGDESGGDESGVDQESIPAAPESTGQEPTPDQEPDTSQESSPDLPPVPEGT